MKCELVAAYAAGGLDPAEAAKVEELLARDDDARAELIEIRKALAAVKAARPLPASEPDWDAMAREIRQACAGDDPAGPGWLARVAARLGMGEVGRPARWWARPVGLTAIASGVAGAAAIAIAVAVLPGENRSLAPRAAGADEAVAPPAAATGPAIPAIDDAGRAPAGDHDEASPGLADLSAEELKRLERALDRELGDDAVSEDAFVADLLRAEAPQAGEPTAASAPDDGRDADSDRSGDGDGDDRPAIDPFRPPDYLSVDDMADQLPDEALDAIDRYLAEVQAG